MIKNNATKYIIKIKIHPHTNKNLKRPKKYMYMKKINTKTMLSHRIN